MARQLENLLALALSAGAVYAQITLVGAGHSNPAPIQVAPGEVTTLYISGLNIRLSSPLIAPPPPLPMTLGGISLRIQQGANTYPVPLFSIDQTNTCATATTNECFITSITVQIPFELVYQGFTQVTRPVIIISVNGADSQSLPVTVLADNTHILTSCDSTFVPPLTGHVTCDPLVTHADGSSASYGVPVAGTHNGYVNRVIVSPGETIVIYATGLGPASSPVTTGAAAPSPAARVPYSIKNVGFVASQNAGPVYPWFCGSAVACPPSPPGEPSASAWLVPGYVGLYQINITLPQYTAAEAPGYCSIPLTGVDSNITISLLGDGGSLTGLGICMEPPPN